MWSLVLLLSPVRGPVLSLAAPTNTPTATFTPPHTPTSTNTPTNAPTNTPTATNTPTLTPTNTPVVGNQGCTPGFWKNHTNAWCGSYSPNTLVSTVFHTSDCGCDFSTLTFLQALSLSSGNTLCEAQGKLFQMGVSALLNACGGSGVAFPLTTVQIIAEVNAALDSCDRTTTLNEASRLDAFNNGPGGCPLGGSRSK